MYCPKCGAENPDNSIECVSCGEAFHEKKVVLDKVNDNISNGGNDVNSNNTNNNNINNNSIKNDQIVESPLIWSILVTIFGSLTCCCLNPVSLPAGIVAIIFAAQVPEKVRRGDIEGAMQYSKVAKILNWVAFGFIILTLLVFGFLVEIGIIFNS